MLSVFMLSIVVLSIAHSAPGAVQGAWVHLKESLKKPRKVDNVALGSQSKLNK
jgi:hypothetical protein